MTEKENLINAMKSGDIGSSLELTEKILSEGIPAVEIADSLIPAHIHYQCINVMKMDIHFTADFK